jgi:hypothetical protein
MADFVKKQYGADSIKTGASDAFERFEALGFVGINTGGWADKIVKTFGEDDELKLGDLDEIDKTAKADETTETDETDETTETDETPETDETAKADETTEADDADEIARVEKERDEALAAQKEAEENSGKLFGLPSWLVALGAGVGGYFLGNSGKDDSKTEVAQKEDEAEYYRNLAIQNQQRIDQLKAQQGQVLRTTPVASSLPTSPLVVHTPPVVAATLPNTTPYSFNSLGLNTTPFATYPDFSRTTFPTPAPSFAQPYPVLTTPQVIPQSDWYSA